MITWPGRARHRYYTAKATRFLVHEFSLEYLRCVHCGGRLELDVLHATREVNEGFLTCRRCAHVFPIVMKIPVMWKTLRSYLSERRKLGGLLYAQAGDPRLKSFIRQSLGGDRLLADKSDHESHWARVYSSSRDSAFYSKVRRVVTRLDSDTALEHGCSVGTVSAHLSKHNRHTLGIDRSFSALLVAKTDFDERSDYFVADSLNHPFGSRRFDTVVGLNLLEIIEPTELLSVLSRQVGGTLVLADPYDNDRGASSVRRPVGPGSLRLELARRRFRISADTQRPGFIPWRLKISDRAEMRYRVDLVVSTRG